MGDEGRVARVRELYAEYEYGILDGSAVVPESRLREIERLIAAETPVLVQLAEEALASRAVEAAAREGDERAAALWNRIGLAFAKHQRPLDEEERAARAAFMAFCDEQQAEIARLQRTLAATLEYYNAPRQGDAGAEEV